MPAHRIQSGIADGELGEVAGALSDAFGDYPVEIAFTADSLRAMFAAEDVSAGACRLLWNGDDRLLGVGLGALRGDRGRIAAMGVVRDAHGEGIGRAVGAELLEALAEAGAREVVLEALTVNAPALTLYERHLGFVRRRRLVGFTRSPGDRPISQSAWDEALAAGGEPDSWQLGRVVRGAREQDDLISVPAVVPEHHPIAQLLASAGFAPVAIDQFELVRA